MDLLFFRTAVGQATFPRGLQSSQGSRAEWKTGVTWVGQDLTDVPARGGGEAPTMLVCKAENLTLNTMTQMFATGA